MLTIKKKFKNIFVRSWSQSWCRSRLKTGRLRYPMMSPILYCTVVAWNVPKIKTMLFIVGATTFVWSIARCSYIYKSYTLYFSCTKQRITPALGWSEIKHLFVMVETGQISADQVYFCKLNSQKWSTFALYGKVLIFKEMLGPFKWFFYICK